LIWVSVYDNALSGILEQPPFGAVVHVGSKMQVLAFRVQVSANCMLRHLVDRYSLAGNYCAYSWQENSHSGCRDVAQVETVWLGRDLLVFLHEKIADRVRHNLLGISNGSQVSNILWMVSQAAILGC